MRYFLTVNASRPSIAGGLTFVFEPVQNRGGAWLGILSVEEDSAASTLASAALEGVDEIAQDYYEILKKKLTEARASLSGSPQQQAVPVGQPIGAVRLAEESGATRSKASVRQDGPVDIIGVILGLTTAQPPAEPLLQSPSMKANRRGNG